MFQPNEKQKIAITAAGSVVVRAGAGTGKTQMLAGRFIHEVIGHNLSPLEIVAVTFTEKAAAELRSRVRAMMLAKSTPQLAAEADAAMIGTIHSLAAHICREFSELVDLPADFAVLDENESTILLAGSIDEALFRIDPEIIERIGYSRLKNFLYALAEDPLKSLEAFSFTEDHYREQVQKARTTAIENLISSEAWKNAKRELSVFSGKAGDLLEEKRLEAIESIEILESTRRSDENLFAWCAGFRRNLGRAANWDPQARERVIDLLAHLKKQITENLDLLRLEFGAADQRMIAEIEFLKKAFDQFLQFYTTKKKHLGVLDFADLEIYALELLRRPEVREHYALRWKALLIDEYQDTNPTQERILERLAESGARITIVGDEKQSIYAFRGADPLVFDRAVERIGNTVSLSVSFRTHSELVDQVNRIFQPILRDRSQDLSAARNEKPHDGPFVNTIFIATGDDANGDAVKAEAVRIAAEIARLLNAKTTVFDAETKELRPAEPRDIAVLARKWAPLESIGRELRAAGIPAVSTGGEGLLKTREAIDAMAVLEFAIDPTNDIALVALLRSPMFCVSDTDLYRFAQAHKIASTGEPWWDKLSQSDGRLRAAYDVLLELTPERTAILSPVEILQLADRLTGYSAIIANLDDGDRRLADWRAMQALLQEFAKIGRSDTLGAVRYLRELVAADAKIKRPLVEAGNAVRLLTIHAAKGLEWPIVFVSGIGLPEQADTNPIKINAARGLAFKPSSENESGDSIEDEPAVWKLFSAYARASREEETCRLLYVAATRARDRLYLTSPGGNRHPMTLLQSALEAAGIGISHIDCNIPEITPVNGYGPRAQRISQIETRQIPRTLPFVPVSGLTDFAICPKRFEYRYLQGNPGLTEGAGGRMAFGKLVHLALELGVSTTEDLEEFAPEFLPEELAEALAQAETFRREDCYAEFRRSTNRPEVEMEMQFAGTILRGRADLVGDDFVLDFKTGESMDAEPYRFQLWAYAKHFEKPRAAIAFLSHGTIRVFERAQLSIIEKQAEEVMAAIRRGEYPAMPEKVKCENCFYRRACKDSAAGNAKTGDEGAI